MNSALNRFNWIAGCYDGFTRIVFGNSMWRAQTFFLNEIPSNARVLIIGGGTGWLLGELLRINTTCTVDYVEASSKMIQTAREAISSRDSQRVQFVHGTENEIPQGKKYDAVITNFFFDLFLSSSLERVNARIMMNLCPGSFWIVTDFVDGGKSWQKLLLRSMYIFFRVTCSIEASQLPDYEESLLRQGIKKSKEKFFFGSFIKSALYRVSE